MMTEVSIPNNILRKIVGSKRYKAMKAKLLKRWLSSPVKKRKKKGWIS